MSIATNRIDSVIVELNSISKGLDILLTPGVDLSRHVPYLRSLLAQLITNLELAKVAEAFDQERQE